MGSDPSIAASVALLQHVPEVSRRRDGWRGHGDPEAILEQELGLFAGAAIADAEVRLQVWKRRGWEVVSIADDRYPQLLCKTAEPPPLLFIAGELRADDRRAVAVVGTREPTARGRGIAGELTRALLAAGYTVASGLAAGIDAVVHRTALDGGGRTIAVIGNGLEHCYPPQNAGLQRKIATEGAVVSQFLPSVRPSRRSFPLRNVVMSGLTLATVIVEASATSGTRVQATSALSQGRRLLLMPELLMNAWARDLVGHPEVQVLDSPSAVIGALGQSKAVAG